eukprot:3461255-Pleurochrysis_carterae.AAC.1
MGHGLAARLLSRLQLPLSQEHTTADDLQHARAMRFELAARKWCGSKPSSKAILPETLYVTISPVD